MCVSLCYHYLSRAILKAVEILTVFSLNSYTANVNEVNVRLTPGCDK